MGEDGANGGATEIEVVAAVTYQVEAAPSLAQ